MPPSEGFRSHFVTVTEVQAAQYLENVFSRLFPVEAIAGLLQFVQHVVIKILEDKIDPFSTAENLDHVHQIFVMQFLDTRFCRFITLSQILR